MIAYHEKTIDNSFDMIHDLEELTIENAFFDVGLSSFGASIRHVGLKKGRQPFRNIALTLTPKCLFPNNSLYAGATLAPAAGRIEEGILLLGTKEYHLSQNENGSNHLHGGFHNLSFQKWNVERLSETSVLFSAFQKDGTDGYPGSRSFYVEYAIEDNRLSIRQWAQSDVTTYCNLSNHTYFNLNAFQASGLDQYLLIRSEKVVENDASHIPVRTRAVKNTEFDFTDFTCIGEKIKAYPDSVQLEYAKGFNHHFILSKKDTSAPDCSLLSFDRKLQMDLYTDAPAIVLYSGGFIERSYEYLSDNDRRNRTYPGCAVALEPVYEPFRRICIHGAEKFSRSIKLVFQEN